MFHLQSFKLKGKNYFRIAYSIRNGKETKTKILCYVNVLDAKELQNKEQTTSFSYSYICNRIKTIKADIEKLKYILDKYEAFSISVFLYDLKKFSEDHKINKLEKKQILRYFQDFRVWVLLNKHYNFKTVAQINATLIALKKQRHIYEKLNNYKTCPRKELLDCLSKDELFLIDEWKNCKRKYELMLLEQIKSLQDINTIIYQIVPEFDELLNGVYDVDSFKKHKKFLEELQQLTHELKEIQ
ncbi:MAG: hypothetical protein WC781_05560 [Candidatus Pacearchaeota archaeon]|jgi:hypothetical protein